MSRTMSIDDERFAKEMAMARHIWRMRQDIYTNVMLRCVPVRIRVAPEGTLLETEYPPQVDKARERAETASALWIRGLMHLAQHDDRAVDLAFACFQQICWDEWPALRPRE